MPPAVPQTNPQTINDKGKGLAPCVNPQPRALLWGKRKPAGSWSLPLCRYKLLFLKHYRGGDQFLIPPTRVLGSLVKSGGLQGTQPTPSPFLLSDLSDTHFWKADLGLLNHL